MLRSRHVPSSLSGQCARRSPLPIAVALLLALLSVESRAQTQEQGHSDAAPQSDTLLPGDVVRLRIWREPDLSGEFPVDEQSTATLPLIGPVRVRGISRDSLKRALTASYLVHLRNPSIEVTLLRRVNVLGSVRKPGLYPVDPTMTVADALALAGGITPDAKRDAIRLQRRGDQVAVELSPGTQLVQTPLRSGDELYVPQRSWISRNPGFVVGTLVGVAGLVLRIAVN